MDKLQVVFLGTSSVVPTVTRNHSAILLKYKERTMLIDCGEGTQRQLRKAKINPTKITDILITHFHGDHVFGLPGLIQTLARNNYTKTLNIYGPKQTKEFINNLSKISLEKIKININVKEVSGKFLETKDFVIEALPLDHNAPCNGYAFIEKDVLRIDKKKLEKLKIKNSPKIAEIKLGKDITINNKKIKAKDLTYLEKGRKIAFVLDTKMTNNTLKLSENSDLAIIESTFLDSKDKENDNAKDYKHLTAGEAAAIAKKAKAKKLILTHLSQRYEYKDKVLLKEAKKTFKNTTIAKDFMKINL